MGWDHEYKDADKDHRSAHRMIADWHRSAKKAKDEPFYDIKGYATIVPLKSESEAKRIVEWIREHGYVAQTHDQTHPSRFNLPKHVRIEGPMVTFGVFRKNVDPFLLRVGAHKRRQH